MWCMRGVLQYVVDANERMAPGSTRRQWHINFLGVGEYICSVEDTPGLGINVGSTAAAAAVDSAG